MDDDRRTKGLLHTASACDAMCSDSLKHLAFADALVIIQITW